MTYTLAALLNIPLEDQALRAADAGWETARWTFWLFAVTALLVMGAVAAAIYARRTWQTAQDQIGMMQDSEERLEAANVSSWLHQPRADGAISVRLRNDNPAPIYELRYRILGKRLTASAPGDEVRDLPLVILPPASDCGTVTPHSVSLEDFKPDSEKPILNASEFAPWSGNAGEAGVALEITFRDSKGVKWKRNVLGALSKNP